MEVILNNTRFQLIQDIYVRIVIWNIGSNRTVMKERRGRIKSTRYQQWTATTTLWKHWPAVSLIASLNMNRLMSFEQWYRPWHSCRFTRRAKQWQPMRFKHSQSTGEFSRITWREKQCWPMIVDHSWGSLGAQNNDSQWDSNTVNRQANFPGPPGVNNNAGECWSIPVEDQSARKTMTADEVSKTGFWWQNGRHWIHRVVSPLSLFDQWLYR